MSNNKTLRLTVMFAAIALLVSGSLVLNLRNNYAVGGRSPTVNDALHLLQDT